MRRALLTAAALGCGPGLPPCDAPEFVAMASDFEDYERWHEVQLEAPDPRLGTGARTVWINALPEVGATEFPQCTMLVKVGQTGADPTGWLMVAMAKRGGGFNAGGATGWEWFDLDLAASGEPAIDWRGPEPPAGRGYECALGEDEAGDVGIGDCTTCHAAAADNDFVLTPDLQL